MEHWFDDVAKKLASGDRSRRTFLGGIFAAVGAAGFQSPVRTEKRGSCTIDYSPQPTLHHSVQSTFNGKTLTHTTELTLTRPDRQGQAAHIASTRTITLGSDLLVRIQSDSREGSTKVNLSYGAAFRGVRQASYTTDGKVIEGTIDGRRISPLPVGADVKSLRFADRNPPPSVTLDPALERALTAILQKAHDDISSCRQAELRRDAKGAPKARTIPQNSDSCQNCQNSCAAAAATCDAAGAAGSAACFIFFGACAAAAIVACAVAGGVCVNNCDNPGTRNQPGGACCPVGCPNVNGCCYADQQCSGTANVCCASNVSVCAGVCCPPGFICKDGICCTTDRPVCHGVCCSNGQACSSEGICCRQLEFNTKPVSCGGSCCAKDQKCAKSAPNLQATCCPKEHVCGQNCCPGGCVNGDKCQPLCLTGVHCGANCCPWGCADAATSTCSKPQNCAKDQYVCLSEQSGAPNVCCPNGTGCLNGKCCPPNTVSCNNKSTGVMGCWPKSNCAVPPPPR